MRAWASSPLLKGCSLGLGAFALGLLIAWPLPSGGLRITADQLYRNSYLVPGWQHFFLRNLLSALCIAALGLISRGVLSFLIMGALGLRAGTLMLAAHLGGVPLLLSLAAIGCHGVVEVSAFSLAAGAAFVSPAERSLRGSSARVSAGAFALCVLLLSVAAVLESSLTPVAVRLVYLPR